jgi:CheY-like chemotaxis protein
MKTATEVLLVDDNPGDTYLIADVLMRKDRHTHVHSVADGVEAMAFLRGEGKYANAVPPTLIVLDLNMPRKDGQAVLSEVKSDPGLQQIPVVVFSTSKARDDIAASYRLGANSYVSKPGDLNGFVSAVTAIGDFWLGMANVPRREEQ